MISSPTVFTLSECTYMFDFTQTPVVMSHKSRFYVCSVDMSLDHP